MDKTAVFTIGYGGRPPTEFCGMFAAAGVRTVADIRMRPDRASMGASLATSIRRICDSCRVLRTPIQVRLQP
jgi:hypothetical protein